MKQYKKGLIFLFVLFSGIISSCHEGKVLDDLKDEITNPGDSIDIINPTDSVEVTDSVIFKNNPLPDHPEELKVLGIGNSFLEDATWYLPDMLADKKLRNILICWACNGSLSLDDHFNHLDKDPDLYFYTKLDTVNYSWPDPRKQVSLKEIIKDEDWDVIVLQQSSKSSGKYETFQPALHNLIDFILKNCRNKDVTLAWHMTWAYGTGCKHQNFEEYNYSQQEMYEGIIDAAKKMEKDTGIDIIIPSGTAIQNLRNTKLNNAPLDLTRDGMHSDEGAGRYVEAVTWFESLIKPCYGKAIDGCKFRLNEGNVPVTDENIELILKAAKQAVKNKYEVSQLQ